MCQLWRICTSNPDVNKADKEGNDKKMPVQNIEKKISNSTSNKFKIEDEMFSVTTRAIYADSEKRDLTTVFQSLTQNMGKLQKTVRYEV